MNFDVPTAKDIEQWETVTEPRLKTALQQLAPNVLQRAAELGSPLAQEELVRRESALGIEKRPLRLLRWPEEWGEMPVSPWHRPGEAVAPAQAQMYISPKGWKFTQDFSMFISPEGEQFTLAEAQTQLRYMGFEALQYDYSRNLFVPTTMEGAKAAEVQYADIRTQLAEIGEPGFVAPPGTPGAISIEEYQARIGEYNVMVEEQREALSSAFSAVFPGQTIDDLTQLVDSMTVTDDMSTEEVARAGELQADFLETISTVGRTPETEFLLRTVFSGASEEAINELFGIPTAVEFEEENWFKDNIIDPLFAGASSFVHGMRQAIGVILPSLVLRPPEMFLLPHQQKLYEAQVKLLASQKEGLQATFEKNLADEEAWLKAHPELTPKPEYQANPFENPELFRDPGYYAYIISSSLAYTVSVISAIVATTAVTGNPIVGLAAGFGVAGAPESANMTKELVNKGVPFEDAVQWGVLYGSVAGGVETASSLPLLGIIFKPIKKITNPFWKALLKGTSSRLAKASVVAGVIPTVEGFEEVVTEAAHNAILQNFDASQSILEGLDQAFIQGVIAALPWGGLGGVASYRSFRESLPADTGKQIDELTDKFVAQGMTEEQAQVVAANEVAKTPKGAEAISQALEKAKETVPPEVVVPKAIPTPEVVREALAATELRELHNLPARVEGIRNVPESEARDYLNRVKNLAAEEAPNEVPNMNEAIRAFEEGDLGAAGVAADTTLSKIHKLYKIRHPEFDLAKPPAIPKAEVVDWQRLAEARAKEKGISIAQASREIAEEQLVKPPTAEEVAPEIAAKMTKAEFVERNADLVVYERGRWGIYHYALKTRKGDYQKVGEITSDSPKGVLEQLYDRLLQQVKPTPKITPPVVERAKPEEPTVTEPTEVIGEGGVPVIPDELIPQGVVESIPILKDIGLKERWARPSRKVYNRLGLYEIHKGIQKAEVLVGEARNETLKRLKELRKSVGKNKERWALIADEANESGSVTGLTFQEKRVVAYMRKWADAWADIKNLDKSKRIKNYFPHLFEQEVTRQLKENDIISPELAMLLSDKVAKKITDPFLKERLGAVGWIKDPFKAMEAYEAAANRVLYYEPLLQKVAAIANDPNCLPIVKEYLKDFSRRMTGEPNKIDVAMNNELAEFAGFLKKMPGTEGVVKFLTRGNPAAFITHTYTGALYFTWMGWKATTAIRNLSQHTLIISEVGPANFAIGTKMNAAPTEEYRSAMAESVGLRGRKLGHPVPGLEESFTGRWIERVIKVSLAMFRGADLLNTRSAFCSGYAEAKARLTKDNNARPVGERLSDEQIRELSIERGDEVLADTQYLYTKMNAMALSQSSPGRVLSVLTTWMVNWMELITKWVSRRPSQVYLKYERLTGRKLPGKNWSQTYKAILLYAAILGLGYLLKDRTRLKAWEYTGITSIRYLADIMGGEFPGLEAPGAVADIVAGFITGDERQLKAGWANLKRTYTLGIIRQVEGVASGERDWLTLLLYLEGKDFYIKKLKNQWEKGWIDYEALEKAKDRTQYRKDNPLIEAQMFITSKFTTLSSDEARQEVLRLIEENKLDTELIDGYDKVFGVDTDQKFTEAKNLLGTVELDEEGEQKLKENGELDYYTTSNFASDVNALEKVVGRPKIEKDGNALAIEYLRAKDLMAQYEGLTTQEARDLYRQQFPDVEALLYLWGKITTFKNPKSAEILLKLMEKYNIPPESVPAFLDNPGKYDELFTQKFELEKKTFDLDSHYEDLGNPESDIYIADSEERKEARAILKEENPGWMADTRRIEAIDHDASPETIEAWVERGKIVDEYGGSSPESKVWLLDHPEVHEWALREGLLTDNGSDWNEPLLRLNIEMQGLDEGSEEYKRLSYRKDAYQIELPESLVDTYVDWYMTKRSGYEDDWYLMENNEFYQAMVDKGIWQERDFSKIPTREQAKSMDDFYELPDAGYDREWFLKENKEYYNDVWLGVLGNQPIDFSKLPTREVFDLYLIYQSLPKGSARLAFRVENSDLDEWGQIAFGWKPATGRLTTEETEKYTRDEEIARKLAEIKKGDQELALFTG